ncbi:MAG: hypothetical protein HYY49_13875 [Ignavibacteriales bacterium]|nr:hypothetical protein [Ignavibacteriales bacterium]
MKRLVLLLSLILITAENSTSHGSASFERGRVAFFYSSLGPHGEWIEIESGMYAWRPLRVRLGWRPYMYGRWAWTDHGWYWVSQEPFGWAVYHYGRWYYDDFYGWIWIPDDVWGPAWVEWRYNDDYIGWAPLPPYAHFSFSVGIRFTTQWVAPVHYWSFIHCRNFGSPVITRHYVDAGSTRRLIRTTRSAGGYEVDRDRIINRGVDRGFVERRGRTRIDRMEIADVRERSTERVVRDGSRERIEVYRPKKTEMEQERDVRIDARRADRRTTLDLKRIERTPRDSDPGSRPAGDDPRQIERGKREQEKTRESTKPRERREQFIPENRPESRTPRIEPRQAPQREQRELRRDSSPQYQRQQLPSPRVERQTPGSRQPRGEGNRGNQPRREERKRGRD